MPLNLYAGVDAVTVASSTLKALTTQSATTDSRNATQQPGAEVSITSTASILARLQQALAAQSPVDQKRVDAISRALAAGNYTVHVDKIAEGLINTERALGELMEI